MGKEGYNLKQDKIGNQNATVGVKGVFKWSWLATKLTIFITVGTPETISINTFEEFAIDSVDYAIKNKGGLPRGFQTGIASIAALASNNVNQDVKEFAQKQPAKHFAAIQLQVVYDLKENKAYYYEGTPIWGRIYYGYLKDTIKNLLT